MKKSLLVASLLAAWALAACNKSSEQVAAPAASEARAASAPVAASEIATLAPTTALASGASQ